MHLRHLRYAAAALLLAGAACGHRYTKKPASRNEPFPKPHEGEGLALDSLDRYKGCDDLKSDLRTKLLAQMEYQWKSAKYFKTHWNHYAEDGAAGEAVPQVAQSGTSSAKADAESQGASTSSSIVDTNVQVKGVAEPDEIKMNERSIFIADNQQMPGELNIAVVTKNPLAAAASIRIPQLSSPALYTVQDQLVVTGMQQGSQDDLGGDSKFTVKVYDVKGTPSLQREFFLPSQPVNSRMIGSKLFVVLRETLRQKQGVPFPTEDDLAGSFEKYAARLNLDEVFELEKDAIAGIKCTSMIKLPPIGERFEFQRVISYDAAKDEMIEEVAVPGSDAGIYMTNDSLYIFGPPPSANIWIDPNDTAAQLASVAATQSAAETLVIKKISLDVKTGKLTPAALGKVQGHLKGFDSQWAFNEMRNDDELLLSVVTTTGDVRDHTGKTPASNHLVVLRQKENRLVEAASVKDFGENEDIRSVRYIGRRAYVVTFKRTDPLFTIDLANPLAPKIVGELKIPGFSLYMQPHAENRLIGVGYQTEESGETDINRAFFQGILFQLFDTADPAASKRLDYIELGKRGSYSEANQDHHAFYYDAQNKLAGVPVVLFDDDASKTQSLNGQTNHSTRLFSGAIFYRIQDQKLEEVKRVSHFELLGPTCQSNLMPLTWTNAIVGNPEVRRLFRDGNRIFAVSNFGVTVIDATTFADLETLKLNRPDCRPQFGGGGFE